VSVGDKPLKTIADLSQAVVDAKDENQLAINLLRHGEAKTITVTPSQRPERPQGESGPGFETIIAPEGDGLRRRFQRSRLGQFTDFPDLPRGFRLLRPGTVIERAFPDDLSVQITKEGKHPAKIVVEQGDQKWEVTEETLSELPEKVRGHVQGLLGRIPGADFAKIVTGEVERGLKNVKPPAIPEIPKLPHGPLQEQFQHQLDQINEQLDTLRDTLKDLRLDRPKADKDEKTNESDKKNSA